MNPKLTADDAFDLSKQFHDLSTAVGDYRYKNVDAITPAQMARLKDAQFMLLNQSNHMVTEAVGLELDDAQAGLAALNGVTAKAQKALKNIADIKKAIEITAALVKLGAAVASENPAAITAATQDAVTTITG